MQKVTVNATTDMPAMSSAWHRERVNVLVCWVKGKCHTAEVRFVANQVTSPAFLVRIERKKYDRDTLGLLRLGGDFIWFSGLDLTLAMRMAEQLADMEKPS